MFESISTHKIIESAHVRIDEFVEKSEEESYKEPEDYRKLIYYEPDTLLDTSKENKASPLESPKSPSAIELQPMQPKFTIESKSEGFELM